MKDPRKVWKLLKKGDYEALVRMQIREACDDARKRVSKYTPEEKVETEKRVREIIRGNSRKPLRRLKKGEREFTWIESQYRAAKQALVEFARLYYKSAFRDKGNLPWNPRSICDEYSNLVERICNAHSKKYLTYNRETQFLTIDFMLEMSILNPGVWSNLEECLYV